MKSKDKERKEKVAAFKESSIRYQILTLHAREEQLLKENEAIKRERERSDADTHEFVAHYQNEMKKKDASAAELIDTLGKLQKSSKEALSLSVDTYEAQLRVSKEEMKTGVSTLNEQIEAMGEEMKGLMKFKSVKDRLEMELAAELANIKAMTAGHELQRSKMTKTQEEDKSKAKKDMDERMGDVNMRAREEAQKKLDFNTRHIISQNLQMADELKFQSMTIKEIEDEMGDMEAEVKMLRREITLKNDVEKVHATRSHVLTQEINELTNKIKNLEEILSQIVHDFTVEKDLTTSSAVKKSGELSTDINDLRQVLRLKNKELGTLRQLTAAILNQRTEVENHFVEALGTMKEITRKEWRVKYHQLMVEYNSRKQAAALDGVDFSLLRPVPPPSHVRLRDLSWEAKEMVLRMMFTKINSDQQYIDVFPNMDLGNLGRGSEGGVTLESEEDI